MFSGPHYSYYTGHRSPYPPGVTGNEPEITGIYPCYECGGVCDVDCECGLMVCPECGCEACDKDAA